ncbi:acyl-CoA dehydrogenase [Tropicimonas isoalkanivorans]|uniref:Acyl-CoA dehydrogenase n=1 Tax=Tropicimonas isoalkanivorans TaxID=441112 RepID=A0A1I1PUN3_9RHOB|nr:acyl-CoA dehydrogenase [Tropicimonas isoalkanivorans]SFD13495.1 Acyl-CoA dehydrogenase [Tropicimonas isoalkanivorans]
MDHSPPRSSVDKIQSAGGLPKELRALHRELRTIADAGYESDRSIAASVSVLKSHGQLAPDALQTPVDIARLLICVAAADLSVARLLEGHINVLALARAHGTPELRARVEHDMAEGMLHGVWGADGAHPVAWDGTHLRGRKKFASGLGLVDRAVITARSAMGQQLVLADATDPARHSPEEWRMSGMQATISGGFDCARLEGNAMGPPDVYQREPWFVGGTWRIAAVQLGGTLGLLDRAAETLRAIRRMEADAQVVRLAPVTVRALAAKDFVIRAGRVASRSGSVEDPERAAALSASARLLTEDIGQDAVTAVERSVGLSMFAIGNPVGQMARDLSCYMRQAARDAFLQRAGRRLLTRDESLLDWIED